MIDSKPIKYIISYKDFFSMNENLVKMLLENQNIEFLISIKKDEYKKLEKEEKRKLYGFRRTEFEPLKKSHIDMEKIFIKTFPNEKEVKVEVRSLKEKHIRKLHHYVPRNILNLKYDSKKKGGR